MVLCNLFVSIQAMSHSLFAFAWCERSINVVMLDPTCTFYTVKIHYLKILHTSFLIIKSGNDSLTSHDIGVFVVVFVRGSSLKSIGPKGVGIVNNVAVFTLSGERISSDDTKFCCSEIPLSGTQCQHGHQL